MYRDHSDEYITRISRLTEDIKGALNAVLYGLSIIVLYVGLGLLVTLLFGASALNDLSTNAIVNIFFFLLLVVFALSFFGLFEITLPDSWSTDVAFGETDLSVGVHCGAQRSETACVKRM